jgi:hypothetical protein
MEALEFPSDINAKKVEDVKEGGKESSSDLTNKRLIMSRARVKAL